MRRRTFLAAAALLAPAGAAWAQAGLTLNRITAENDLERAFLLAIDNPDRRLAFRTSLLTSPVALALANQAADSPPRMVQIVGGVRAAAMFTSASRLSGVLGPAATQVTLTGRQALERARGMNVVLNYRLMPMLTLEPEDVAAYLATPR